MSSAAIHRLADRRWTRTTLLRLGLLALSSVLAWLALTTPMALRPSQFPLQVGDVAPQDIVAPRPLTYTSTVLTEQAQREADRSVSPVYLPADPAISRRQVERLRLALAFITTVRADSYSSSEQKITDLNRMTDLTLDPETAQAVLNLSETRWDAVRQEALSVLEQAMRSTIREDRIADVRRNLPTLISYTLPEEMGDLVLRIVSPMVVPNSLYSAEETEAARAAVRATVQPVTRTFVSGETIVLRGQVLNPASYEALLQFGLVQPRSIWQELVGAAVLVLLIAGFITLYVNARDAYPMNDLRSLVVITALLLIFLVSARWLLPNRTVMPYLFPMAAFGLTVGVLLSTELGLIFSLVLGVLASYGLPNGLELGIYFVFTACCGVLVIGRAQRVTRFFSAALAIALAGNAVVLAYRLPDAMTDWLGLSTLAAAALFNGFASASLTLLLQYLLAQVLGLTTALQLLEIARSDHPLLQFMLRNAPGSYQHSLQVANLAEQAAEAIGADALLTRVGAIYHDAGKAMNPLFFIENQVPGNLNPHDDIPPEVSAATIIRHVTDGVDLARKYRLPPRIRDFILEHHGTLLTRYQYTKALEQAGGSRDRVDERYFRYPGPSPRSRETALLMLADGSEARARAELPKSDDDLRLLIQRVFDFCQREGQLDRTSLTLSDLSLVKESFVNTLRGIYHPRIAYPELKQPENPSLEGAAESQAEPGRLPPPTESLPNQSA